MKTMRIFFCCACLLVATAIGALAQSVQTDYDHNFNLANFKSYGFYEQTRRPNEALAASPINDRRIHDALDSALSAAGLASSAQPDFWIAYSVTTRQGLDIQDNRFGIFQRMGSVNVNPVTQGTLIVAFFDSLTNREVWRGYAQAEINPKNFDKDVKKAVGKLIQKFKKNQAGEK